MKLIKQPVTCILLFFIPGIITGYYFNPVPHLLYPLTAIAFIALCGSWLLTKNKTAPLPLFGVLLAATCFLLGMATQSLHYAPNNRLHYTHSIDTLQQPAIKGVITERLKPNTHYQKYYFDVKAINGVAATGKLLVSVPKDAAILQSGQVLLIRGMPQPFIAARNPGQFDYGNYMHKQGIYHQLTLKSNYIITGTENGFTYHINRLRNTLMESFELHHYNAGTQSIINALLFGQRQDLDTGITTRYADAGVMHILAISGLHFGVLFFILNFLLKPLKHRFKSGKVLRFIIMLTLLWGFALITGMPASVTRAVVMFSFILLGQLLNRTGQVYNSIAVSMQVILLVKPRFIFDAGFQLSYAAVFAIVWLQPLYNRITMPQNKVVRYFYGLVAVSVAAQLGVLPLSLYYFHQFPLLFLVANIVVIPLVTAILIVALAVLLLNFIAAPVALLLGKALYFMIWCMDSYIGRIASLQGFIIKNIAISLVTMCLLYLLIIAVVQWMYKKDIYRTAFALTIIFLTQLSFFVQNVKDPVPEMAILHNFGTPVFIIREGDAVTVLSTDSSSLKNKAVLDYSREKNATKLIYSNLKNVMSYRGRKVLVLDSLAVYPQGTRPDILVLTHAPKTSPEAALNDLQPAQVVADGTNYKSYTKRWETACQKAKIPFHATAEKGYFVLR